MKNEDDDVRAQMSELLAEFKIELVQNAKVQKIIGDEIFYNDTNLKADVFLLSLGRRANSDDLGLKNAEVSTDERANIITNEHRQTSQSHIFALGDVRGGELFTYTSLDDFRVVFSKIFGDASRSTQNASPHASVVFTPLPLAKIGLSQKQAQAQNREVKVLKLPLASVPNGKVIGDDRGFLKAVVDAKDGLILGCTFFCTNAHELINQIAIAMRFGAKAADLKDQIFTHPSTSEALNDLFGQF